MEGIAENLESKEETIIKFSKSEEEAKKNLESEFDDALVKLLDQMQGNPTQRVEEAKAIKVKFDEQINKLKEKLFEVYIEGWQKYEKEGIFDDVQAKVIQASIRM